MSGVSTSVSLRMSRTCSPSSSSSSSTISTSPSAEAETTGRPTPTPGPPTRRITTPDVDRGDLVGEVDRSVVAVGPHQQRGPEALVLPGHVGQREQRGQVGVAHAVGDRSGQQLGVARPCAPDRPPPDGRWPPRRDGSRSSSRGVPAVWRHSCSSTCNSADRAAPVLSLGSRPATSLPHRHPPRCRQSSWRSKHRARRAPDRGTCRRRPDRPTGSGRPARVGRPWAERTRGVGRTTHRNRRRQAADATDCRHDGNGAGL